MLGISALDAAYDALATAQAITDGTPTIQWSPNDTNAYIIGVVGIEDPEGDLVAWVRVPKLYAGDGTPSSDTVIYMYYGNVCVSLDTQDADGVWDSNFKAVWHLKEDQDGRGIRISIRTPPPMATMEMTTYQPPLRLDGPTVDSSLTARTITQKPRIQGGVGNLAMGVWTRERAILPFPRGCDIHRISQRVFQPSWAKEGGQTQIVAIGSTIDRTMTGWT